jgi:branched-chain amino acid transport system ATP-binding protein
MTPTPTSTETVADHDGLKVRGLEVVYNNAVTALSGVSIDVPPGGFVSVLGANGAGKTTLVRTITSLLFVHNGQVRDGAASFGGVDLLAKDAAGAVRSGICQVPEGRMLFPRLTVDENLRVGAATRKDGDVAKDLDGIFDIFPNLAERRSDKAGLLSGGEQQMVAVGRALMARPKLLICDELSLGLAPMIVRDLFALLTRLNQEEGLSVLVIEQNARVALAHSKYGYVLETGRQAVEGTSEQLSNDPYVQDTYLGGAGEAKDAFEAVVSRYTGRRSN